VQVLDAAEMSRSGNGGGCDVTRSQRVLYVEGAEGLSDFATSPAQPVELVRSGRDEMLPPANRARPWRASPSNEDPGAPPFIPGALSIDLQPPELIALDSAVQRVGLQVVGRFVELLLGLTIVGRSRSCHIPIHDPQISRRHAAFSNTGREVACATSARPTGYGSTAS
jgi:FHA domain